MAVDFAQLRATTLNRPSVVSSLVLLGRAILGLQTGKAGVTQTRLVSVPLLAAGPLGGYILDTETVTVAASGLTGAIDAVPPTVTDVTFGGTTIAATSTSRANPVNISLIGFIDCPASVDSSFAAGLKIPSNLSAATTPTLRIGVASQVGAASINITTLGTAMASGAIPVAVSVSTATVAGAYVVEEVAIPLNFSGNSVQPGDALGVHVRATSSSAFMIAYIDLEYSVTETLAV